VNPDGILTGGPGRQVRFIESPSPPPCDAPTQQSHFYALVASSTEWAEAEVANWPEDIASHRVSPERTREVLERVRWSSDRASSPGRTVN
jgi:hypothetical protein